MSPRPTPLGCVAQAMNFQSLRATDPPVVATLDHRAVLLVAWAAHRQGLFDADDPPLLLRLDAHPDMGERPRPWAMEHALLTDTDTVMAFANDQRCDDGGWAITAVQWGLARDVATFFVHDYHRFPGDDADYTDHRGIEHRLWTYASFAAWREARAQGSHKAESLARELGLESDMPEPPRRRLWVDIDLDFATRRHGDDERIREWTPRDWADELGGDLGQPLAHALHHATLVTLALEPWFCGGMAAAGRLADGLKTATRAWGPWFEQL